MPNAPDAFDHPLTHHESIAPPGPQLPEPGPQPLLIPSPRGF